MKKLIPLFVILALFSATISCSNSKDKEQTSQYSDKLNSVTKDSREFYINWDAPTVRSWPNNKESLSGEIFINDIRTENFRSGYNAQHVKNAYLKGTPYHVPVKQGQTVQIYFRSKTDPSKRTNAVKFVWPWKSTY